MSQTFFIECFQELPDNDASVTLLGVQYDPFELEEIKNDLQTRLWFTYRKNFANIGGNGPTSDQVFDNTISYRFDLTYLIEQRQFVTKIEK